MAGGVIRIEPAIEVGNIFKLGTRYSEPLDATVLDRDGKARHVVMGSYGIGPARIMAASVEQHADEQGISWPRSLAPWDVELVALGKEIDPAVDALYEQLEAAGLRTLFDDRVDAGAGQKFKDAELVGVPLRITAGKRALEAGAYEVQLRRGQEQATVPVTDPVDEVRKLWETLP